MLKIKRSIEIHAPVHEVFEFITRPENLPAIWPSLVEVSDVRRKPDGSASYEWVYKMAGVRVHGHGETIEFEPDHLWVEKNDKGIKSTFRWSFEAHDGATELGVEVDYELPGKILGKLAEPLLRKANEHEAELVLANARSHFEQAAPQPHA